MWLLLWSSANSIGSTLPPRSAKCLLDIWEVDGLRTKLIRRGLLVSYLHGTSQYVIHQLTYKSPTSRFLDLWPSHTRSTIILTVNNLLGVAAAEAKMSGVWCVACEILFLLGSCLYPVTASLIDPVEVGVCWLESKRTLYGAVLTYRSFQYIRTFTAARCTLRSAGPHTTITCVQTHGHTGPQTVERREEIGST